MYLFVKKVQNVYFTNVGKNINKSTWEVMTTLQNIEKEPQHE